MTITTKETPVTNRVQEELWTRNMRYDIREAFDENGNKADMIQIELNGNWGNKVYTTRRGMNLLYKAIKNKTLIITRINDICKFIESSGEEVQVGRYLNEYYKGE
jgi:hypothetical protein